MDWLLVVLLILTLYCFVIASYHLAGFLFTKDKERFSLKEGFVLAGIFFVLAFFCWLKMAG